MTPLSSRILKRMLNIGASWNGRYIETDIFEGLPVAKCVGNGRTDKRQPSWTSSAGDSCGVGADTPPLLLTPKKYDWCTRSAFALQALRIYELYRSEDLKSGISFSHYKNLRGGFFRGYTKTAITQGWNKGVLGLGLPQCIDWYPRLTQAPASVKAQPPIIREEEHNN